MYWDQGTNRFVDDFSEAAIEGRRRESLARLRAIQDDFSHAAQRRREKLEDDLRRVEQERQRGLDEAAHRRRMRELEIQRANVRYGNDAFAVADAVVTVLAVVVVVGLVVRVASAIANSGNE